MTSRWYAVHTKARGEDTARFNLRRQGYQVWLPQYLKRRSHARRVDWVPAPLFPRYLFVRLDPDKEGYHAIRSTIGVSHLVCAGGRPAAVPEPVIEEIRGHLDEQGFFRLPPEPQFQRGEAVRILAGPFRDCAGIFDYECDEERVLILLDLLGREVRVYAPREAIAAAM